MPTIWLDHSKLENGVLNHENNYNPYYHRFVCQFLICQNRADEKGSHPANKVAYLQAGEVWISTVEGLDKNQITATAGKVEDFVFSGDLKYLAYSKILKYVDEPGIFEDGEEVPERALCSVVVQDLRNRKVLWEVIPKDDWIYPARWLPGGKLLCYESSGFDVAGFFEWDAVKGSKRGGSRRSKSPLGS